MVDFQVFLESQPWVVYSEFTDLSANGLVPSSTDDRVQFMLSQASPFDYKRIQLSKRKKQRRQTIFEGKTCFLVDRAICAIHFGTNTGVGTTTTSTEKGDGDWFALDTEIHIEEGGLFFEWTNDQATARCLSRINHHAVVFLRKSRPKFNSHQPCWVSFDFGRVQIRLWRSDKQDFSLDLIQSLHEQLAPCSPSNNDSDVTKISTPTVLCDLNDRAFLDSLTEAMDLIEQSQANEDQTKLFDGLTDIIRLITVKRSNI